MPTSDRVGETFGRLTVRSRGTNSGGRARWNCECSCGNSVLVRTDSLTRGLTKSCGCLHRELSSVHAKLNNVRHGMSGCREHSIWASMRQRCSNPKDSDYPNYGGRGILVDPRWDNFEIFYADMGEKPEGLSLDRIDNDGPYSKENCRWATPVQQRHNQRRCR